MRAAPEIRYLGDVQRLALEPADIVVLKVPGRISQELAERLRAHFVAQLGADRKILILSDGIEIGILSPELNHGEA